MPDPIAQAYRPEILHTDRAGGAERLVSLRRDPHIDVLDTLREQVADLVKTRHPDRALGGDELDRLIDDFIDQAGGEHYGAWVHFPWARRIVRLLPKDDFIELRTDRNHLKITAGEQAALAKRAIGIVGLSVGQSVALTMAMERICGEIRLADFDVIDLSNLNRLRCGVHQLGLSKTVVAAREIAELDPYLDVRCFSDGYTKDNADAFLDGLDLVVDECDSLDVKFMMRESARARRIPLLMSTSDRGMVDIERFDTEPDRPIFHGRLEGIDAGTLAGLTTEQKIPILMTLVGVKTTTLRMRVSLLEIGQSIKTWPQLASDVTFGGAAICDVARRTLLGQPVASGCYLTDFLRIGDPSQAMTWTAGPEAGASTSPSESTEDPVDAKQRIVFDAAQAPSAGNAQPWQWQFTPGGLSLHSRPSARPGSMHVDDGTTHVALGAALESALISARHLGFDAQVFTATGDGSIAHVALTSGRPCHEQALYPQIARRRTLRRIQAPVAIPPGLAAALKAQVDAVDGVHLSLLTAPDQIETLALLVGEAERLTLLDPGWHEDRFDGLTWGDQGGASRNDGIPVTAMAGSAAERAALDILRDPDVAATLADWNLGRGLSRPTGALMRSAPLVGLIWTTDSNETDFLAGGRVLQRVWLQATAHDAGLCPVSALCVLLNAWRSGRPMTALQTSALPGLDARFRQVFGLPETRGDIALFRLAMAPGQFDGPRDTPRRPLDQQFV